jgi:hypothetical protein
LILLLGFQRLEVRIVEGQDLVSFWDGGNITFAVGCGAAEQCAAIRRMAGAKSLNSYSAIACICDVDGVQELKV